MTDETGGTSAPTMPPAPPQAPPATGVGAMPPGGKSRVAAGVLGILLGSLGVHKFYLGYTGPGAILLAVTVLSFGTLAPVTGLIGLIEGILYLAKSDEDFYATYVAGRKPWF